MREVYGRVVSDEPAAERPRAPGPGSAPAGSPPWAGAPGYTPPLELPPHAPLPGAPPYPERAETAPPSVAAAARRTSLAAVLGAATVWAVVALLLALVAGGSIAPVRLGVGLGATLLLTALVIGVLARRRAWSFTVLLLASAPVFWVLRAVLTALVG